MKTENKMVINIDAYEVSDIERRVTAIENKNLKDDLEDVLDYIYTKKTNECPKSKLRRVEIYLTLTEIFLANTLTNYTNDTKGKKAYGPNAIKRAKNANYSCEKCGENDVRCIEIDHIDGNRENTDYENLQCICGSCHNKKTKLERLIDRFKKANNPKLTSKLDNMA